MARKKAPLILEVDKEDLKPLGSHRECQAAIVSLGEHLGFLELLRRFRVARAMLESRLKNPDEPLENTITLRSLIKAYSFAEQQLKQETGRPVAQAPREPFEEERSEYERLAQAISLVGGAAN